jgi:hypothetical protein
MVLSSVKTQKGLRSTKETQGMVSESIQQILYVIGIRDAMPATESPWQNAA